MELGSIKRRGLSYVLEMDAYVASGQRSDQVFEHRQEVEAAAIQ